MDSRLNAKKNKTQKSRLLQQSRRDGKDGRDAKPHRDPTAHLSRREEKQDKRPKSFSDRDATARVVATRRPKRDNTNFLIARLPTQRTNRWPTKSNTTHASSRRDAIHGRDAMAVL
ncbi:hypothetical protein L2E82_44668 [Cichorium intybus]|uniref:Uncharacterized protein n=1 Tax=Cichorium intybus TaxID=13427 RepID=A0ACB8ZS66_CICIN|nr:hypothetical protein L2E82_44668 [Cichorium intybus]